MKAGIGRFGYVACAALMIVVGAWGLTPHETVRADRLLWSPLFAAACNNGLAGNAMAGPPPAEEIEAVVGAAYRNHRNQHRFFQLQSGPVASLEIKGGVSFITT